MSQPRACPAISVRSLRSVVYGPTGPVVDDLAETYHEASKAYPSTLARQSPGLPLLEASAELRWVAARSVKRYAHRARLELPVPARLSGCLADALARRRSTRSFSAEPVSLSELATLLHAAYGITQGEEQSLRTAPSGGALYPLELYTALAQVAGVPEGLYHYDPLRHVLEELELGELDLREAMVYPELLEAPVLVFATAMFWRTRFKYGLRGYRFALIEAGHVMQNLLLACSALRLAAVPIGGFFDRRLEARLGVDGVNESVVYGAALGRPGASA
jgi:SagB-type dehydrogenase family enzyme